MSDSDSHASASGDVEPLTESESVYERNADGDLVPREHVVETVGGGLAIDVELLAAPRALDSLAPG